MITESKIIDKNKHELFQDACECLSFILKMKNSELIHVFHLDDEEKEINADDIECAIFKTFIDCNLYFLLFQMNYIILIYYEPQKRKSTSITII